MDISEGLIRYLEKQELEGRIFLVSGKTKITYEQFLADLKREVSKLQNFECEQTALSANLYDSLILLFALEHLGKRIVLIHQQLSAVEIKNFLNSVKVDSNLNSRLSKECSLEKKEISVYRPGEIVLMTSGTTGHPKGVVHSMKTLCLPVKLPQDHLPGTWLLTYNFYSFAGFQVILHAVLSIGTLVISEKGALQALKDNEVTHISGTPSFWRFLLSQITSEEQILFSNLKQITLGGETVPQELLDRLSVLFPKANITQIYASTEMGACFIVKDRKAGLPEEVLSKNGEIQTKIVDGELCVKTQSAMRRYLGEAPASDEWFLTGDLVKCQNGRIYFLGRKNTVINVGGRKVFPYEVEDVIYQVPGVIFAKASGEKSSLMGEMVKVEVEIDDAYAEVKVRLDIDMKTKEKLAAFQRPRIVRVVKNSLVLGDKISRKLLNE